MSTYQTLWLFLIAGLATACGSNTGTSTRLDVTDYDQSCLDITQCILVDLEACSTCNCPDAAISEAAYDAFATDKSSLQDTYCPEPEEESCPSCALREPRCRDEVCGVN